MGECLCPTIQSVPNGHNQLESDMVISVVLEMREIVQGKRKEKQKREGKHERKSQKAPLCVMKQA